jgi:phage tail tape-measure protein
MSGTSNKPNRLAHYAALVGAGATAATVAHLAASRKTSAPPAAPSEPRGGMPFATDSAFVGLIESVAAATANAETIEDAVQACVEHVCRWTGWPVGHVYLCGEEQHDSLKP